MARLLLALCMLWHFAYALSMTTMMASTTTPVPTSANVTTETVQSTPATTTKPTHTELLRQDLSGLHLSHRQRGRVILATTHMEGSDDWGVGAEQAELSCDRIARLQHGRGANNEGFLFPVRSRWNRARPKMEGHLLSIGSSYEVITLSRLLHPLPDGSFWTGGKLTRYRVNSMKMPSPTDHIVLTWTDGKVGRPQVLGMTREDEAHLQEGYTYCLALNLRESAWQARDCSDQLPYACLITPRQVSFSNKAQVSTEVPSTNTTTTPANEATSSSVSDTTEGTTTPSDEGSETTTTTASAVTNNGIILNEASNTSTPAAEAVKAVNTPLHNLASSFQQLPEMLGRLFSAESSQPPNSVDEVQSTVATPLSTVTQNSTDSLDISSSADEPTATPALESTITSTADTAQQTTPVLLQATELTSTQSTPVHSTVSTSEDDEGEVNDETDDSR